MRPLWAAVLVASLPGVLAVGGYSQSSVLGHIHKQTSGGAIPSRGLRIQALYEQHIIPPITPQCDVIADADRIRTTDIREEERLLGTFSETFDDLVALREFSAMASSPDISTMTIKPPKSAVLALGKMAAYAYHRPPDLSANETDEGRWEELGDWTRNASYGWISEGLRAHLFLSPEGDLAVLTFKGTSLSFAKEEGDDWPTHKNDKINDNLMFSCCCGLRSRPSCECKQSGNTCDQTCHDRASHDKSSYYAAALRMYNHVKRKYPKATILLSGHSLGGSIAALVSAATNSPAVAFQAPGEERFARRLGLIGPGTPISRGDVPVWHIGHTADPIYTGTCTGVGSLCRWFGYTMQTKCHLGRQCLFDTITGLGWLPHVKYHRQPVCLKNVLEPWATQDDGDSGEAGSQTSGWWPGNHKDDEWNVPWKCGWVEEECEDCTEWTYV